MTNLLTKTPPLNSAIEVRSELNRTVLSWKNPRGGFGRIFGALFLLAWLGGWTMGEISAARQVYQSFLGGTPNFFVLFWLAGWTVGGAAAAYGLFNLLRPTRPETLILDSFDLKFRRGTPSFEGFGRGEQNADRGVRTGSRRKFGNKYELPKKEIGEVRLERVGERQRLTIDHGAERIEIGRYLEEPDREWLHGLLRHWKGGI